MSTKAKLAGALLALIIIYIGLVVASHSQESDVHSHMGNVGHFYQTWMRPEKREYSCCSDKDCYATEFKAVGGTWFYLHRETGTWKPIPAELLEDNTADPRDSPDGRNHICANPEGFVFCAVRGGGM